MIMPACLLPVSAGSVHAEVRAIDTILGIHTVMNRTLVDTLGFTARSVSEVPPTVHPRYLANVCAFCGGCRNPRQGEQHSPFIIGEFSA